MRQCSVEIIIVHRNGIDLIDACLKSVLKTKYKNYKITVVDNASTDDSVKFIKTNYPLVKLIQSAENLGFSKGNNVAIKESAADYVILLNNDATVDDTWLDALVKVAESDKKIAACQPKVMSLRNKGYFDYAGAAGCFMDRWGYTLCRGRVFDNIEKDTGQYNSEIEVFWSCGVAMLIKKSVLDKIGLLDEDFFSYAEEIDLCWRMQLAGYKIMCVPNAVVHHLGSASWGKKNLVFKKEYLLHRNHIFMLFKNYSFSTLAFIIPVKILLEFFTILAFFIIKPLKSIAIMKSMIWNMLHLPLLVRKNREIKKIRILSDKEIMKKTISECIPLLYYLFRKKTFNEFNVPLLQK